MNGGWMGVWAQPTGGKGRPSNGFDFDDYYARWQ